MSKWRVGIIGNGGICKGVHLEEYLNDVRFEVVALCDIIEERAQYLKDNYFPNADVYTDYKELLKDETIDSVDICTPNYLHSIIAVAAFEAGEHVFCEKPDAVSVAGTVRMDEAAKKAGKTLMVMRNNRFIELRGTKSGLSWHNGALEIYTEQDGELLDIAPANMNEKRGHMYNLRHFFDVVIDGTKPIFEPQQSIDMIKILCAIYESARTGKEVILQN